MGYKLGYENKISLGKQWPYNRLLLYFKGEGGVQQGTVAEDDQARHAVDNRLRGLRLRILHQELARADQLPRDAPRGQLLHH